MKTLRHAMTAGGFAALMMAPALALAQASSDYKSTTPSTTMPSAPTAKAAPTTAAPEANDANVKKLIGKNIVNAQNEKVGDINSIYVDKSGAVDSVIVGVGGFLGMGEKEVAIKWSSLNVQDNGDKVTTNLTKDQLKSLPEFKFKRDADRGTVFHERDVM